MSGKIEISRKLIERAACNLTSSSDAYKIQQELLEALAAPVVERQPVAYVLTRDDEVCYEADDGIVISNTPGDETNLYKWKPVYFDTSPPAPVAVLLPERFDESQYRGTSLLAVRRWNACLDKVKELNQ